MFSGVPDQVFEARKNFKYRLLLANAENVLP